MTFVDKQTVVTAAWLNAVDAVLDASILADADPTGVADSTAALQAAIDANYGETLHISKGTYKLTTGLTITDSIEIVMEPGAVLDYSGAAAGTALNQKAAITIAGALGATTAITSSVAVGDRQIAFNTTGFAVDEWVIVKSAQLYMDGVSGTTNVRGHICRIKSIDSGSAATMTERSPFAYDSAQTAVVQKMTQVSGVTIRGGTIQCGGVGSAHSGVSAMCALDLMVDGVSILDAEDCGVQDWYGVSTTVRDCRIERCTSPGGAVGNTGYGTSFFGSRTGRALHNRYLYCRHPVSGGGPIISTHCLIDGNESDDGGISTTGYDCHEPAFWWTFSRNKARGGYGGFLIRGQQCRIVDNEVTGVEGRGIHVRTYDTNTDGVSGTYIGGNKITGCGVYGILIEGLSTSSYLYDTQLIDNDVSECRYFDIRLDFVDGVRIRGGTLGRTTETTGTNGSAIRSVGTTPGDNKNIDIDGVRITDQQRHGIHLQYTDTVRIGYADVSNINQVAGNGVPLLLDSCTAVRLQEVIGADPSGVADSTTALQASITAAYGGKLHIPEGTYTLTTGLAITDSIEIELDPGAVLNFSTLTSGVGIYAYGTAAAAIDLSSSAAAGDQTITLDSVTGIAAGTVLRIYSDEIFDVGRTNSRVGELVVVQGVSGSDVTLTSALIGDYATTDNAAVEVITPIERVKIRGGKMVGVASDDNGDVGILFYRARDCEVDGVRLERFDSAMIRFRDSMHCHARKSEMVDVVTNSTGYGVSFMDATQDCSAAQMYSENCRHAVTTNNTASYGGIPRRCEFSDSLVVDTARASLGLGTGGDALDTHAAAEDIAFRRNTVIGASGQGMNLECRSAIAEGNRIIGAQSHGIGVHNEVSRMGRFRIRDNVVWYCGREGGTVGDGLKISSGNNASALGYEWVELVGNEVKGAPLNALRIGTDSTRRVEAGLIARNVLDSRDSSSTVNQVLYATNSDNVTIESNVLYAEAVTQTAIRLTDVNRFRVRENRCVMATSSQAAGIWLDGTSADGSVVSRNVVEGVTASSLDGVVVEDDVTNAYVPDDNELSDCNTAVNRGTGTTNRVDSARVLSVDIASGAVSVFYDTATLSVDTESAAASDDLDTISGGYAGQVIVVKTAGNTRDVTAKNGTGNLRLGADVTLDNTRDTLLLMKVGTDWHKLSSADNGA